jgi:hypothetical protein
MPKTLDDIKAQLEALQRQLDRVDVTGSRERHAAAEKLLAEVQAAPRLVNPNDQQQRHGNAFQGEAHARRHLSEAVARSTQLRGEIERLSAMLFAGDRITAAKAALATASEIAASASVAVSKAQQTARTIEGLIKDEQQKFEIARSGAAAALFAAVKAGGDGSTIAAPNLDRVATLELARDEAARELEAASAALQAAQTRLARARQDLAIAQVGQTDLAHELALSAYVETLHAHQAAYHRAHRQQFGVPNLHELLQAIFRAEEARAAGAH